MASTEVEFRIPFTTLLKIALAVLLAVVVIKLWPIILMIIIATLIAVMLDPIVVWLEARRVRRPFGITAVAFVITALLVLFFFVLVPVMSREIGDVMRDLPRVIDRLAKLFPPVGPFVANLRHGAAMSQQWLSRGITAGKVAVEGVSALIFVLVVAIYLIVEGRRAFSWLISFAPRNLRGRIDQTAEEVRVVMLSYVRGAVITATICAIYVMVVLSALHVPAALLFAVLAFIFDFIPVVGTIIMMVPATLLALLTSPTRALLVAGAYLLYHLIEAYVLIPRIWGQQMRVSTLTVLLAIAIGGTLQGAIGAVLALPIAAAYPIIERIWLREHLPPDTVARHEELEETQA